MGNGEHHVVQNFSWCKDDYIKRIFVDQAKNETKVRAGCRLTSCRWMNCRRIALRTMIFDTATTRNTDNLLLKRQFVKMSLRRNDSTSCREHNRFILGGYVFIQWTI